METHACRQCAAVVMKRNKICPRCGTVTKSTRVPIFWFMFTAWLFVAYACLDFIEMV